MESIPLRLMKDRRYEVLPVDQIIVLNSRDRDQDQFSDNVKSIETTGLLKPVLVNERFRASEGKYELICGEGRLIAHQRLGKKEISAEVIDCDRKQAYLISLIENIARVPPGTMWFGREVKRLRDAGMTYLEISRIIGKTETQAMAYVRLIEKGEERLLYGVDQGIFPLTFAFQVAESDDAQTQALLMDAFEQGLVSTSNLRRVRNIIRDRQKSIGIPRHATAERSRDYTVEELKKDIAKTCREKEAFVREAEMKEGRLVTLVEGLRTLRTVSEFIDLLRDEGLAEMPDLQGPYRV
jgi:ParB family chromosome partitioning protein